jgi:hypothetical protein
MTCLPYAQLIDIKRWADRGLYDVIGQNFGQLTSEEASIMLRILDHIHAVDRIFQHHLQGLPHGFQAARSSEMPVFEVLAAGAREVDDWYASYVGGLTEDDFEQPVDFVFTSGKPARNGRETLASSGSHCSAASLQKTPVSEQIRLAARDALQPLL